MFALVRDSVFHRIAGNALWTHSLFTSPRLNDGLFANNEFDTIGRDAIRAGCASKIIGDRILDIQ